MKNLEELEFLGWPASKVLDHIAHELGSEVHYYSCSDMHSTSKKIVIEYGHQSKGK